MRSLKNMSKSSSRGVVILSVVLLCSLVLVTVPTFAYADKVDVKSVALEETTIIELTNNSDKEVETFRIWLGSGFSFESFKTEKGWIGEKTQQGVIIFTSSEVVKTGESVKFGVKTDKAKPGINWKALDKEGKQITISKVVPEELSQITSDKDQPKQDDDNIEGKGVSMTTESTFRIIPEKPNVGSPIRVTGDKFGAFQEFDFYINTEKIGSFETDKNGHFMTTMKIPADQEAERVDFMVKDKEGEEKKVSLRIVKVEDRIVDKQNIKLTLQGMPDIVHRGDKLDISGTGDPNSAITAKITTSEGEIINTRTAEIDSKGNWKIDEQVLIPTDTPFGKYKAIVSDGREEIEVSWTVESDKVIIISPTKLKTDPGEIMKFNGTALPNVPIEVILEDPLGKEVFSNIIQVDESGDVKFGYTTEQTSTEGTYTLIATQNQHKEFIFAGLGQVPIAPVNLEFDKLNYKAGEIATISLTGKPSDIVSLLIIDPSDKPKGETISITLQPDARGTHTLDLTGYSSGVYTAVVSKGSSQNQEIFTVGLQSGSGEIGINTTKNEYYPGDSILILGETNANILLTITMTDPDENQIKVKETFSDKNGKISEDSFRIPSDGKPGTWKINAKSGSNFDSIELDVLGITQDGMAITITDNPKLNGVDDFITIHVFGVAQTVKIDIVAEDGEIIDSLQFPATQSGEINQPWKIPKDIEPGTYTIIVTDAFNTSEQTFEIQ